MAGVDEERAAPAISSPSVQKATDAGEDDPVERYMRATRARARAIADHPLLRALRARVTTAAARVAASPQYAALGELLARSLLGACLSRLLPCVWWWGEADAAGWMFEGGRATGVEVRAVWLAAWSVVGSSGGTADVRGATLRLVFVYGDCSVQEGCQLYSFTHRLASHLGLGLVGPVGRPLDRACAAAPSPWLAGKAPQTLASAALRLTNSGVGCVSYGCSSGGTADVRGATLNLVPVRAGCRGGRRAERAHATWVQNVQHPSDPQRPGASGPCHSCSSRPNPTAPQQQQKWRWKSPERAMRQQIDRAVKRAAEEQANPLLTPLQTGSRAESKPYRPRHTAERQEAMRPVSSRAGRMGNTCRHMG